VDHVTALPCLLLGLDGFRVLTATTHGHELVLLVETTTDRDVCRSCGVRAGSKGRARTTVRDVPIAGRPTVLVWRKRIWRCEQPECDAGSWRETTSVVRSRAVLTERARAWARAPGRPRRAQRGPGRVVVGRGRASTHLLAHSRIVRGTGSGVLIPAGDLASRRRQLASHRSPGSAPTEPTPWSS
jgi:transposase